MVRPAAEARRSRAGSPVGGESSEGGGAGRLAGGGERRRAVAEAAEPAGARGGVGVGGVAHHEGS